MSKDSIFCPDNEHVVDKGTQCIICGFDPTPTSELKKESK